MGKVVRPASVQLLTLFICCAGMLSAQESTRVSAETSDGVTVFGETYFGPLDDSAPLILLFHQGGSNGRGEYGDLAPYLNAAGLRAIAWDLRAGGDTYGSENRTSAGLSPNIPREFCDAYADLQAALDFATSRNPARSVVLWGSSYSAPLIFRLAAENPTRVSAVIAFSPASGGPMEDCRARMWIDQVSAPMAIFRPASEMTRDSSIEQREALTQAGAEFFVVEHGVHGSSMLVDSRTGHDMGSVRQLAIGWLHRALAQP